MPSTETRAAGLAEFDELQTYNGRDCAITRQVFDAISPQLFSNDELGPPRRAIYNFEMALMAPALEMMCRGIKIDRTRLTQVKHTLAAENAELRWRANYLSNAIVPGLDLAPPKIKGISPKNLKALLHEHLGYDPIVQSYKGQKRETLDREALEKLSNANEEIAPIINIVTAFRDRIKLLGFLSAGVDPDGRMRTSYNVAATETGRWSSSENAFGSGTNFQNLPESVRPIFVSDPGHKLAYVDLEQAESRVVGLLAFRCSGDKSYLEACASGDLHTTVAKMVWPELGWTGNPEADRKIADQKGYREFSYRDLAKRLGHGTNYNGTAWTMARVLRIPRQVVEDFQQRYFSAFPGIRLWHKDVAQKLQTTGIMISMLGRVRVFMGRLYDDATLREAIAFEPQSVVGDTLNACLLEIWRSGPTYSRTPSHQAILLGQVHDAVIIQYPIRAEHETLATIKRCMAFPLGTTHNGVILPHTIPCDFQVGYNWGKATDDNPAGLVKYRGPAAPDTRKQPVYRYNPFAELD